jgi:hypothetical protein
MILRVRWGCGECGIRWRLGGNTAAVLAEIVQRMCALLIWD